MADAQVEELRARDDIQDFDDSAELEAFLDETDHRPWKFRFDGEVYELDFARLTGAIMLRYMLASITVRLQMLDTLLYQALGEDGEKRFKVAAGKPGSWPKVNAILTEFADRLNGQGKASRTVPNISLGTGGS